MSNLEKKEAAADPQPMDLEYAGPVPPGKARGETVWLCLAHQTPS